MLRIKLGPIMDAIRAARPAEGMLPEWRAGANSACDFIGRYIGRRILETNQDFDVDEFLTRLEIDPDTFTQ